MPKLYSFGVNVFGKPDLEIWSDELVPLAEFSNMEKQYVNKIVDHLEKVFEGELETFEFGYDATIIDFMRDRSIINYEYFEKQTEISSQIIFQLMRDWRDYLNQFNN